MFGARARRSRGDRGANTIEYCALATFIGAIVVTAIFTDALAQLAGRFGPAVCRVAQGECGSGAGPGDRQGWQSNRTGGGDRFGDGTAGGFVDQAGEAIGRVVEGFSPWHRGESEPDPGRADGEEVWDSYWDEDRGYEDWDDWVEDVNELIEGDLGDTEYAEEFFRGVDSYTMLHIFGAAVDSYDEDGDGFLDAGELARAREDLEPLATMVGAALGEDTLPEGYRDQLLAGDPEALAMLIDAAPGAFPPDFVYQAVHRVFEDPTARADDQLRALQALGENPEAAQRFLSHRDNLDLFEAHPLWDHDRTPDQIAEVFDAALRHNVGGFNQRRAFGNIVDYVNDHSGWFDDGDFTEARQVLATHLEPYLPQLSRFGQHLAGRDPDGPYSRERMSVSPEDMQEFLGVILGDPESREIFNDAVLDYAAEHDPLTEIAPDTRVRDLDEFLDRTDEVGGLLTLAVLGQNEAHLSAQERRDFLLDMYDTVTGGPARRVLLRAASRLGGPATVVTGETIDRIAEEGRQRLDAELQEGVDAQNPAAEANRLIEAMTEDLDAQLEAQGVTDPGDRETMTRLITLVYRGELYDGLVQIIDAE